MWELIDGYNYSVSDEGQVRNNKTGRILRQFLFKSGYYYVGLSKQNQPKMTAVHRLVALAFIPLEEGRNCVDHINNIKTDNNIQNLRWASHTENARNSPLSKRNTSGFKGVSLRSGKWRAQIMLYKRCVYIGNFDTIEEAVLARQNRANEEFGLFTNACEVILE